MSTELNKWGIKPVPLDWPEDVRPAMQLLVVLILVSSLTSIVMEVAYFRQRWRMCLLVSRIVGLFCVLMFSIWPSPIMFAGIGQSIAQAFVDPHLHLSSFKRNPQHLAIKLTASVGKLLHHAGGLLIAAEMMRPMSLGLQASGTTFFDQPVYVAVVMGCQFLHWVEDILVLMRGAPRWLRKLGLPLAALQTVALLALLLFSEDKYNTTFTDTFAIAAIVGNAIDFVGDLCGNKASTYEFEQFEYTEEYFEDDVHELVEGKARDKSKSKHQKSVARIKHDADFSKRSSQRESARSSSRSSRGSVSRVTLRKLSRSRFSSATAACKSVDVATESSAV